MLLQHRQPVFCFATVGLEKLFHFNKTESKNVIRKIQK